MVKILISSFMLLSLFASITFLVHKRRKTGVKGWKTALTSICFYAIALINLAAYWWDGLGILSWMITLSLLMLGAYFTRYMALPSEPAS
ncbi:hypothetical protein GLW00_06090 [Halobacillus litoralis]|uniref:Uncharacterized protein n=1 Tax=Halobacillus litoralis TaxID=45668 RepID=A0A845F9U4_9BACI|nr:hypothetical protein [Halobacillus litoralis]